MSPKVTYEHREARRQQIIESAAACVARNGFHKTTMQDICREADLSPGAIYVYFESKDQIIQAMCLASAQRNTELIGSARGQGDTAKVFSELADAFFALFDDPEFIAQMRVTLQLWAEGARSAEIAELIEEEHCAVRDSLAEIIRIAQERAEVNPDLEADAAALALISFFNGFVIQKTFDPEANVQKYKDVIKAMGLGRFWIAGSGASPDPSPRLPAD